MNNTCQPVMLERDETTPLSFRGHPIGHGSTENVSGVRSTRWAESVIYRTDDDRLVASVIGRTAHKNETDRYWAAKASTPALLAQTIENHFGRILLAFKLAMKDAGIWEQTANTDSLNIQKNIDHGVTFREATIGDVVKVRVYQDYASFDRPQPRATISLRDGSYYVESAEVVAMSILEAIDLARQWDDAPLPF